MELRPYQIEAIQSVETAYSDGERRQIIVLPTGTGKTVIFSELMRRMPGRRLCLVHRDELVRQTVRKLADAGLKAGVIKANEDDVTHDVVVASIQTLSRERRLAAYVRHGKASLVVVDEAHHAPAPSYRRVIDNCLASDGLLVGVTATPDRKTHEEFIIPTKSGSQMPVTVLKAGMAKVFSNLTYFRQLTDMIAEGWLCDVVPVTTTTNMDMSSVSTIAGDWSEGDLGAALDVADGYSDIIHAWQSGASDRPTIAFLPTVATSQTLCERFQAAGVPSAHIDGTTPVDERQKVYQSLRSGSIRVVTNCMVLTEGFDEPSVSCIIVARPTQSRSLFAQMIGRGTRLYPGKSDCLVISVTSHDLDVSPVTLQTFLNDPGFEDGQSVKQRQTEILESIKVGDKVTDELKSTALSFANKYVANPAKSKFIWRKLGPIWTIIAGTIRVDLKPAFNDHWEPTLDNGCTLCAPLPLEGAVSVAEQYVAKSGASMLADTSAKWRSNPPSSKQVWLAITLGIDLKLVASMSKGELSEWITTAKLENRNQDYSLAKSREAKTLIKEFD